MNKEEETNNYDSLLAIIYFSLVFIIFVCIFIALFCNNNQDYQEFNFSVSDSPMNNSFIMKYPNFAVKK